MRRVITLVRARVLHCKQSQLHSSVIDVRQGSQYCISEWIGLRIRLISMVVNTTKVRIRPENRNEFFQTICPLLDPIRNEKGCLAYGFFVDATDENSSLLIGEWQTREDWSNHLRSRDFVILLGAITVLGSPAGIEFRLLYSVAESDDIESNVFRSR